MYASVDRILLETVADGDCGADVLNMMTGLERRLEVRDALRHEMAGFLLKHVGNRALVAMLRDLGEVGVHLGRVELETEAAKLLEDSHGTHHGDGDARVHGDRDDGAAAGPSAVADRIFSAEEVNAVKWKCQLYKTSPESVQRILSALPYNMIQQTLEEYKRRAAPQPPKRHIPFLVSRDCKIAQRQQAAEHFLQFCAAKYGTDRGDGVQRFDPNKVELLKTNKMPRGWFAAYAKAHPTLETYYKTRYANILKMYTGAVKLHFQNRILQSAVADTDPTEDAVPEDDPTRRFRYKTPRIGMNYWRTQLHFARDGERRRGHGGGRHASQCLVREMLMEWYSVIRHSVDITIMVRIPKQVLLVKAQMLQEEYYASCLRNGVKPEVVNVGPKWLNQLLLRNRIVTRRPIRKFKVARWVLAERLEICWIDVHSLRKLTFLPFLLSSEIPQHRPITLPQQRSRESGVWYPSAARRTDNTSHRGPCCHTGAHQPQLRHMVR